MENREIEFKYSSKNISLEAFNNFCKNIHGHELYRNNLGKDMFFTNPLRPETFFRLREDGFGHELTFKKKVQDDNVVRIEHNVDVSGTEPGARALVQELGYSYDSTILKVNHIHKYPWYVLSYYICYNENMVELDRFIEIEMREDHKWTTEHEVFNELKIVEKMFKPLGLSPEIRIKESLYELYRRGPLND